MSLSRFITVGGVKIAFHVRIEVLYKRPPDNFDKKVDRDRIYIKYWRAGHAMEHILSDIVSNIADDCTLDELADWLLAADDREEVMNDQIQQETGG